MVELPRPRWDVPCPNVLVPDNYLLECLIHHCHLLPCNYNALHQDADRTRHHDSPHIAADSLATSPIHGSTPSYAPQDLRFSTPGAKPPCTSRVAHTGIVGSCTPTHTSLAQPTHRHPRLYFAQVIGQRSVFWSDRYSRPRDTDCFVCDREHFSGEDEWRRNTLTLYSALSDLYTGFQHPIHTAKSRIPNPSGYETVQWFFIALVTCTNATTGVREL